jgi:hypothetical protein
LITQEWDFNAQIVIMQLKASEIWEITLRPDMSQLVELSAWLAEKFVQPEKL